MSKSPWRATAFSSQQLDAPVLKGAKELMKNGFLLPMAAGE